MSEGGQKLLEGDPETLNANHETCDGDQKMFDGGLKSGLNFVNKKAAVQKPFCWALMSLLVSPLLFNTYTYT